MAKIDVVVSGNGVAFVDDDNPSQGQTVTLTCEPDIGETLEDVLAWDSDGHSIALYVQQSQTFTWNDSWVAMTISVEFSGSTPPPPTPARTKRKHMPIWMYPMFRG